MRLIFAAALLAAGLGSANAATEIDLFFPVPVQGKLANEMQRVIEAFNSSNADVHVTAAYTGSYDDTNLKTHAAIKAGQPPAVVIMSANFLREYAITDDAMPLDDLIRKAGMTNEQFMGEFWPALRPNAQEAGHVIGAPFQNSTPILYYNTDAFKEAGLDPDRPPTTWTEWVDDAKKLTHRDGDKVTQYGVEIVSTTDYLGWLLSGFTMSNGGQYFNRDWGGEVYYNEPSTIGAVTFLDDLVHTWRVMPEGVIDANSASAAFFSGRTAMMVASTGALGFIRDNMKRPFKVAIIPRAQRFAAPIGGASLIIPRGNSPDRQAAAWALITYLTRPDVAGSWSRFTGYFAPRMAAYDLPEMKDYLAKDPNAKVAIDQLAYAVPWFATYDTVAVRKAIEDPVQAVLSGKAKPAEAMASAQRAADALLKPYVDQTALKLPE